MQQKQSECRISRHNKYHMQQKQSECKASRHTQPFNPSASSSSRHNKNHMLPKRSTMLKSIPCYECTTKATTTFYCLQMKFTKVMFSQLSVCPQEGLGLRSRRVSATPTLGRSPQADTPLADNPLPSACWDTHPCPVHAGIHTPLPNACWDTAPAQ